MTEFDWTAKEVIHGDYILPPIWEWLHQLPGPVLDIGCGTGALTAQLKSRGLEITGIDSSRSGLLKARERYPDIEFREVDICQPLPPDLCDKFGSAVSFEVIEHLMTPGKLFQRAHEAAASGPLIISTPYHGYLKNLVLAITGQMDSHFEVHDDTGHIKFFSSRSIRALADRSGYVIIREKRAGRRSFLAKSMVLFAVPKTEAAQDEFGGGIPL